MKIKQFLMAAAAMMLAVACNDPVEPTPQPEPEFTPETWSIAGTNNEWDATNAPAMAFENDYYVAQNVEFAAGGQFKFVKDNSWTVCRGYDGEKPILAGYYYAVKHIDGAGNIVVKEAGTYDIYLNKATDTFYLMADGKLPAEAQDGATIEVAPAAVAEIAIRESEMAESYIAFNLTTANVAAASYNVLPTEAVDETITAEYVLSEEGGYALEAEDLGTTVETGFRRNVTAGTEYTIFLAYEDLNGDKAMVTETVTTPGAAAGGDVEFVATSYDFDPEWADMFIFIGEEYELVVCLNTEIQLDTDYSFGNGITSVYFKDANGDVIEDVEAGSFSIYAAEGMHCATAEVVTVSGNTVFAIYEGTINGLGGGAAGGAGTFTVASAKFYHSSQDTMYETPVEDTRYCLEIVSTNQDFLFLVIDNYRPISEWGDETPYLNGTFMSFYDPENPTYVNLELSFMMMYQITNFQFLMVQTAMPGADMNIIQAMFTAGSHMNGSVVDFMVNHTEPISMYTPVSWDNAPVITKDVTSYGADGWFVYSISETYDGEPGATYNFCDATYATDLYLSIYDFTQTAPITAVTPGFYPMISEATESGVLAGDGAMAIAVDGSYYSLVMPESATDANGRAYGVTITVPTSVEAEDCVLEAYFTAVDYTTGAPVVFDIKYTGALKGMGF